MNLPPVVPFEPVPTRQIPAGAQWIAQLKWDGVRVLTYFDGQQTRLYNRQLNDRTIQYPELIAVSRYCSASSVILDGEIIALEQGKPSFSTVMKRDSLRRSETIPAAVQSIPIVYMVFDVLFLNGQWVIGKSLQERQAILADIITPQPDITTVENFSDAESLFAAVKAQNLEGIICKDLTSTYKINAKDSRWQKLKNYQDVIAVIGGVTFQNSVVNAVLLGLFDNEGRLQYIGHAGAGRLSAQDWRDFTDRIRPLVTKRNPFANQPDRVHETVWLEPALTVKIQFAEWTKNQTLRQPSIQAFVDAPPADCTLTAI